MKKRNEVLELSFEFALKIIAYSEILEAERKYVIAKQLLRSGTSMGANIREAQSCQSRADFIHKFKIAQKEAEETEYWLMLCSKAETYPTPPEELMIKVISLQKLIGKIISTSKTNKQ